MEEERQRSWRKSTRTGMHYTHVLFTLPCLPVLMQLTPFTHPNITRRHRDLLRDW